MPQSDQTLTWTDVDRRAVDTVRVLAAGEGEEAARLREAMTRFQESLRAAATEKGERLRASLGGEP